MRSPTRVARMGGLAETRRQRQPQPRSSAATPKLAQDVIERDAQDRRRSARGRAPRDQARSRSASPWPAICASVLTAWRIAGDLERVGDLAKNIAKRTLILNQSEPIQLTRGIERMGTIAAAHLKQVLDAYSNRDLQAAIERLELHDDDIDAHYNSLFRELLTYMMEDPRTIISLRAPSVRRQESRAHRRSLHQHRRDTSTSSSPARK